MHILYITVFLLIGTSILFSFLEADAILIFDDDFYIEKFADGLEWPTTMTFVGEDILILEKNNGKVIRIHENGVRNTEPVLDVGVGFAGEAGMLGIESTENYVYLYYTKSCNKYGGQGNEGWSEFGPSNCHQKDPSDKSSNKNTKNSVYRYEWNGEKLTNPVLLKELPSENPVNDHHGGVIAASENNEIYFVIGDQNVNPKSLCPNREHHEAWSGNLATILKIDSKETKIEVFATGVRNSFGLAIDPLTGNLWDTENGLNDWDEINLVKQGFHSGWDILTGPSRDLAIDIAIGQTCYASGEFVYSDPEFSWEISIGVTAIAFPDNNSFRKYSDSLFVGDFNNGRIYKFHLNEDRTGFVFSNPDLSDLSLDNYQRDFESEGIKCHACDELPHNDDDDPREIIFADGIPGGVTDIEFHNDAMYVVSIFDGTIYKISPKQPLPPLYQYQNNVLHKDIVCKTQFMPIMSISSGIYCVKPSTALILADRPNWALDHSQMPLIELKYQNLQGLDFENTDLSYSDLRGSDFSDVRIYNVNFTGANLQETNLSGVDLSGTILTGADLTNSILAEQDLSGKDLTGTKLVNVDFSGVDLSGTILTGVDLTNSIFAEQDLLGKDLTGTKLVNVDFSGVDLSGTILTGADLTNSDLSGVFCDNTGACNLIGVDLSGKDLTGTKLVNVDFSGVDLSGTILTGADLSGTILTGIDLSGKDLTRTILTGADLTNSILAEQDLSGKDLKGVDFTGADLSYSFIVYTDLSRVNLTEADLSYATLTGVDLSGKDLKGVDFTGADLSYSFIVSTDLSYANLTGVNLTEADLSNANLTGVNLTGANLDLVLLTDAILDCNNHDVCN